MKKDVQTIKGLESYSKSPGRVRTEFQHLARDSGMFHVTLTDTNTKPF